MLKLPKTYNDIVIYINIDGLPLFIGSRVGQWPILMTIKGCKYPKPLPIAIFCEIGKPPLTKLLESLVNELKSLRIMYHRIHNQFVKVVGNVFIADAPARAQCVVGHSSQLGCGYCRIVGEYVMD